MFPLHNTRCGAPILSLRSVHANGFLTHPLVMVLVAPELLFIQDGCNVVLSSCSGSIVIPLRVTAWIVKLLFPVSRAVPSTAATAVPGQLQLYDLS